MLGKIIRFARPEGVRTPSEPDLDPKTITADNPFLDGVLDTQSDTVPDRVSRVSALPATKVFLEIAMAEVWQLYTLDGREPPQEIKLTTLVERYQQLREKHPWPYQDKSQLAKSLVACGCKSHRRTHKGGKMAMIEFPAYPAAKLPETSRSK